MVIAIIMAIKDENERNFIEELYIKHNKYMWKYAMYLTKNKDEADELLQISFEKIIKCIDAVKKINCCKMDSYMVSIVRNSYNTMMLKKYKEKESLEYIDSDELSDLDAYDDYESVLERSSSSDILVALENMPDKYKMVLKLKYVYEFDDDQIAKTIGVQTNSVRMYKTRALRMLADRLKGSEYSEK
ncbi:MULTISPECIES: RNA polymerase sigma factor [unclassified Sedimentibacter]|uniref:RNA polymerase sigma factor n=1 Tax=unclassified Sedimentibacter TaxID=2649220 RepID=UPI0027DFF663|nr:RNA polymerase sigma factor [Sedimentibacter sp. MB35-C1]WMJ77479.1 RNA polymerase sigma factor [Sedimentibacter sp. MB35-C1]